MRLAKAVSDFERELTDIINKYSMENGSNTPDYILAGYITDCLVAFNRAIVSRAGWYGRLDEPGLLK